jgi:hypothetical protein
MKALLTIGIFLATNLSVNNSKAQVAQGKIYGSRPDTTGVMAASKVESFMDKKTRIAVAIKGKVLKVVKPQGGWFDIDGGNGKVIHAHFSAYKVTIPATLQGKIVIADGVAQKQFVADDGQHFAGDTVSGKKQHSVKANPKAKLTFEVKGLLVE